nr:helix-turn-helix transcriptional regulator [Fredinandcohnia onubensis]
MIDVAVIGQSIQRSRKKKKLSQVELAKTLEITDKYLSDIERGVGTPSVDLLLRIAVELDVHPGELFGDYELMSQINQPELMLKLDEIYQDIPKKYHEDIVTMNKKMAKFIISDPKMK